MKNILILGDSFAADWSVKYKDYLGWPNLLANDYNITNLAQAGVGEYKIYKQLLSVSNLENYDIVIISHTSPYRIYTRKHPIHYNDVLHKNADLMLSDMSYHNSKIKNIFNTSLKSALNYFKYHSDTEYLEIQYSLLREKINNILANKKIIVVSNLKHLENFITEDIVLDYSDLVIDSPGIINHMSENANNIVYQSLIEQIQKF